MTWRKQQGPTYVNTCVKSNSVILVYFCTWFTMAEGGDKSLEEIMKQVEDLELLAKRKEKLVNQRRQESRPLFSSVYHPSYDTSTLYWFLYHSHFLFYSLQMWKCCDISDLLSCVCTSCTPVVVLTIMSCKFYN